MPTDARETKGSERKTPTRFKQRVLVMQGGGALGAYEAGAFRAFYDWLAMQTGEDENIFDVIAGTSIGAINASIIVSHVKKNRESLAARKSANITKACWEGAADALEDFWLKEISADPVSSYWISAIWGSPFASLFPNKARLEAARKYYAAREAITLGSQGVFSPQVPIFDFKYFDPFNIWFRSSNQPLRKSLEKAVTNFPLKTELDKNEPRLLTVTVDVTTGKAVTFDSYGEETEYKETDYEHKGQEPKKVVIKYKKGLGVEHVLASASVPINYDFQWIPLEYNYDNPSSNHPATSTNMQFRPFWDGGIMSNTPLLELLIAHREFWKGKIPKEKLTENIWFRSENTMPGSLSSKQDLVPNLDVYVINVWPSGINRNYLPQDRDITMARLNNISFGDKTRNDQGAAEDITDFGSLARIIREKALESRDDLLKSALKIKASTKDPTLSKDLQDTVDTLKGLESKIDKVLEDVCNSQRSEESQDRYETYKDLLLGQFDVEKVLRVERRADINAIFNMFLDFTKETIANMIGQGRRDALQTIIKSSIDMTENLGKEIERDNKFPAQEKETLGKQLDKLQVLLKEARSTLEESIEDREYNDALSKLKNYWQAYNQIEAAIESKMPTQTLSKKLKILRY